MSDEKIRPTHRERAAYVYIRQSTLQQVRHHQESHRRQYELQQLARELGFAQVIVIDDDLGVSGSGSKERPGFGRLLTAVCEGKVGGVLALEASRLARNNRDWHHLIDLCVLTFWGIHGPKPSTEANCCKRSECRSQPDGCKGGLTSINHKVNYETWK
jgi:hypothetical protein